MRPCCTPCSRKSTRTCTKAAAQASPQALLGPATDCSEDQPQALAVKQLEPTHNTPDTWPRLFPQHPHPALPMARFLFLLSTSCSCCLPSALAPPLCLPSLASPSSQSSHLSDSQQTARWYAHQQPKSSGACAGPVLPLLSIPFKDMSHPKKHYALSGPSFPRSLAWTNCHPSLWSPPQGSSSREQVGREPGPGAIFPGCLSPRHTTL